jgi:uncharacterized protein YndB with AHSA1/START domain
MRGICDCASSITFDEALVHAIYRIGRVKTQQPTGRAQIRVRRPQAEVFRAFVDAHAMSQFWFTRRDDGLNTGQPSTWYLAMGADELAFEVHVDTVKPSDMLAIRWERAGVLTRVVWTFEAAGPAETVLRVEESGFAGDADAVVAQALDSTGGFNQLLVAAKAWIEHGVGVNIVADRV